jgi:hypothetical protein
LKKGGHHVLITISKRPYTVINGKDFAAYRWHVAGRTQLTKEDLPTDDWIVLQTRAGVARISTGSHHPREQVGRTFVLRSFGIIPAQGSVSE